MRVRLVKSFQFEAAHRNPRGTDLTRRLHGHSYLVELAVAGECDPQLGWLVDYGDISRVFDPFYKQLDHRLLDEVEDMKAPTRDGVRDWIWRRMKSRLECLQDVHVSIVGPCAFQSAVSLRPAGQVLQHVTSFTFEAAHALLRLPETHKCRRMHGHSFRVEVAASASEPLDAALRSVYDALDHRCLNEIDGLENPTSEWVSRWIWERLRRTRGDIISVTVAETCTARCTYHGE